MQKKALFFILAFFACLPLLSVLATAANVKPMDLAQVTVKDNLSLCQRLQFVCPR